MFEYEPEQIITDEIIRQLMAVCEEDRRSGKYAYEISEGKRLADQFRKSFPNVSDNDLGTMVAVFSKAFIYFGQNTTVMQATKNLDTMVTCYSHAAAEILKSVIDLKGL